MISKILQIPSLLTWLVLIGVLGFLVGAYVAKSGADELDLHGANTQATITQKVQKEEYTSGNTRVKRTVYILEYEYAADDGRRHSSSTRMEKQDWDLLKVGGTIPVRYSLQDPEKHQTHLNEYSSAVDTLMIFVWLFTITALISLLFDIRRAVPGLSGRFGGAAYLLLCIGVLSIAGASLLRWNITRTSDGFVLTTGTITQKTTSTGQDKNTTGETPSSITTYQLTYTYSADNGERNEATKTVNKEFYDEHDKDGQIIVVYKFYDTNSHHIRSAANRDAADGWMILGILLIAAGLCIHLWRRWRSGRSAGLQTNTGTTGMPE